MPATRDGSILTEGQKSPNDGKHDGGQQVGDLDLFAPDQIEAHAEDEDVAGEGQIGKSLRRHDGLDEGGQQRDAALKQSHWNSGEDTTLAEGSGHDHDDDQVQYGFGGQRGVVAQGAVLNRTNHRHGADAHREGGGNEAAYKAGVALAAGFAFKPFAELFETAFQVQQLTEERAQREADDHHHSAGGFQTRSCNFVHLGKTAGDADEEHTDAIGAHEGVLKALCETFAEEQAEKSASEDAGYIDKSTESNHTCGSSLLAVGIPSSLAALSRQTLRYTVSEMAPLSQRPSMKSRKVKGWVLKDAQISQP